MPHKENLGKTLQQIAVDENFNQLDSFYDEAVWATLENEQKKLLVLCSREFVG